mgnify:CR=1 FL=1
MYSVVFEKQAIKQLSKISKIGQLQIKKLITKIETAENPRYIGKALTHNLKGFWRYRVENYRIIAEINDSEITIFILEVEHRSKIYKKS